MKSAAVRLVVALAVAALGVIPVPGAAAGDTGVQPVTIYVNRKMIEPELPPVVENGRVLVPMRAVFEALEAAVSWDLETRTATVKRWDVEIKLTIDATVAYRNGAPLQLDVPARLINDRTFVPLRFVAEALGGKADWDAATRTVWITGPRKPVSWREIPVDQLPQVLRYAYQEAVSGRWSNPDWGDTLWSHFQEGGKTYALFVWANRPTTGYSVTLEDVYEDKGQLVIELTCLQPEPGAEVERRVTHPHFALVVDKFYMGSKWLTLNEEPACFHPSE